MKNRVGQTAVMILFLIILLSACDRQAAGTEDGSLPGSALDGTTWTMTSMGETKPLPGGEITAGFMDDQMSGSTGCNIYFYTYKTAGQRITLENGGVTEMACMSPEGVMEQETGFLDYVNRAERFQLSPSELRLITADGEHLIFSPRP